MKKESVVERILAKVVGTDMSPQEMERVSGGRDIFCFEWSVQYDSGAKMCDLWDHR